MVIRIEPGIIKVVVMVMMVVMVGVVEINIIFFPAGPIAPVPIIPPIGMNIKPSSSVFLIILKLVYNGWESG